MLPNKIHDELYDFLQSVDLFTSRHLEQRQPHDEDGITNVLLSSLDADYPPPGLRYTAGDLRDIVERICEGENYAETFKFTLKHERYNKYTEGKITQSDFLLDLSYNNTQVSSRNWRSVYYVQAKKPEPFFPGELNVATKIPYRKGQTSKIGTLRDAIGENGLKYALYCRPRIMTADTAIAVLSRIKASCLHELDWDSMRDSGIWINDGSAETVYDALAAATDTSFTFAQFISMHYRNVTCSEIVRFMTDDTSAEFDLLSRAAEFDEEAIKEIWDVAEVQGIPVERRLSVISINVTGSGPKPTLKASSPTP